MLTALYVCYHALRGFNEICRNLSCWRLYCASWIAPNMVNRRGSCQSLLHFLTISTEQQHVISGVPPTFPESYSDQITPSTCPLRDALQQITLKITWTYMCQVSDISYLDRHTEQQETCVKFYLSYMIQKKKRCNECISCIWTAVSIAYVLFTHKSADYQACIISLAVFFMDVGCVEALRRKLEGRGFNFQ